MDVRNVEIVIWSEEGIIRVAKQARIFGQLCVHNGIGKYGALWVISHVETGRLLLAYNDSKQAMRVARLANRLINFDDNVNEWIMRNKMDPESKRIVKMIIAKYGGSQKLDEVFANAV